MKFGIGQPVPRTEDPTLVRGEGRYTDDIKLAGRGLCGDGAQPPRARRDQGHRHRGGARHAGRARRLYRRRSRPPTARSNASCRSRTATARRCASRRGRRCRPTRCASSAIRSPAWWRRPSLQAKDAAEAVEVDIEPLPAVTRPDDAVRAGRAADLRRCAGQRRARLPLRRQRAGRRRLRQGRACHADQARQQPRGGQRHGAARRDRRLRCRRAGASRCTRPRQGVFGMRGNMADILKVEPEAGARPDRQCRRLVRHEVGAVSRNMSACCTPRARSAARSSGPTTAPAASSPTATAAITSSPPSLRSTPTAPSWRCA